MSLILKPFLKSSDKSTKDLELPFDTEISLSMIESGCIFISLDKKALLIVKSSPDDIEQLKNINSITINFELIERPEFPSLAMHMNIDTVSRKPFKFDYFFNTESCGEIELLNIFKKQDSFDMILFDSDVADIKQVDMNKKDKSELISLIDKVSI